MGTERIRNEQCLLGCMILNIDCIKIVMKKCAIDDFELERHQYIYSALRNLYNKKSGVDLVFLRDELRRMDKLKEIGGVDSLVHIAEMVDSSDNVKHYLEMIMAKN